MLVGPLVKLLREQLTAVMVLIQFLEVLQVLAAEAVVVINIRAIVDIPAGQVVLVVEQEKLKQIRPPLEQLIKDLLVVLVHHPHRQVLVVVVLVL